MSSVFLVCDLCRSTNVLRGVSPNMLSKGAATTFCSTCKTVTSQRVAPSQAAQHQQYQQKPGLGSLPSHVSPPPDKAASPPGPTVHEKLDGDSLWATFTVRLQSAGIRLEDVADLDGGSLSRLIVSLGFDGVQEVRIMQLFAQKVPRASRSAPSQPANQNNGSPHATPTSGGPGSVFPAGQSSPPRGQQRDYAPSGNQQNSYQGPQFSEFSPVSAGGTATALDGTASAALRDYNVGARARCSVHPNAPAEFWCCTDNVLVCSRCHVQGFHKDHPFISLRIAAEGHIRDLTAWSDRTRTQLGITNNIVSNLKHGEELLSSAMQKQTQELEDTANQVIQDILRWKEQLRQDMAAHQDAQLSSLRRAMHEVEAMHQLYTQYLSHCDPLMENVPPLPNGDDAHGDEWALKVLDLVGRLKHISVDAIPVPRVSIAQVASTASPTSIMELIKCVPQPVGVRLPDIVDPGYFGYPTAAASTQTPFTLSAGEDAPAKGILLYNGRTLTRTSDVVPSHCLVTGSQVFYSGTVSWEVHVDRMGPGPGRVLAGIVVNGSDGEGVVWDGLRLVGPNEGECRTIDDRYGMWRPGTVLRFLLELEAPTSYLSCFHERDGVARVALPPVSQGWIPAVSCFSAQDQITVVPSPIQSRQLNPIQNQKTSDTDQTTTALQRQEHLIASLQQQLANVTSKVDSDIARMARESLQLQQMPQQQQGQSDQNGQPVPYPSIPPQSAQRAQQSPPHQQQPPYQQAPQHQQYGAQPNLTSVPPQLRGNYQQSGPSQQQPQQRQPSLPTSLQQQAQQQQHQQQQQQQQLDRDLAPTHTQTYSPELKQLLRYVDDLQ